MFKKQKVKSTLQELEREFDMRALHVGNLTYQIQRLTRSLNKAIGEMEKLEKDGVELKAKIKDEVVKTVNQGKKETVSNEIN